MHTTVCRMLACSTVTLVSTSACPRDVVLGFTDASLDVTSAKSGRIPLCLGERPHEELGGQVERRHRQTRPSCRPRRCRSSGTLAVPWHRQSPCHPPHLHLADRMRGLLVISPRAMFSHEPQTLVTLVMVSRMWLRHEADQQQIAR